MDQSKWGGRFLGLARLVAGWSKDPSTKVGAVITDGNRIISVGYNGLPAGLKDLEERLTIRDIKYEMTIHAEINAILFAGRPLRGMTLYTWPFGPCARCASVIIQVGIGKVMFPAEQMPQEQGEASSSPYHDTRQSEQLFGEAGVIVLKHILGGG